MLALPLAYPDLGEANAVGIVAIHPADAPEIAPTDKAMTADPTLKLAGVPGRPLRLPGGVAARPTSCGAGSTRREAISSTPPGPDDPRRTALRVQAQAAILREELRGPLAEKVAGRVGALDAADDAALVTAFRELFQAPGPLEPSKLDSLASRSLRIGTRLLADAADGRGWPRPALARGRSLRPDDGARRPPGLAGLGQGQARAEGVRAARPGALAVRGRLRGRQLAVLARASSAASSAGSPSAGSCSASHRRPRGGRRGRAGRARRARR